MFLLASRGFGNYKFMICPFKLSFQFLPLLKTYGLWSELKNGIGIGRVYWDFKYNEG